MISKKTKKKEKLSKTLVDITALAEIAQISSFVNLAWRYRWAISKANIEAAKKQGLTRVKNFWKYTGQVEMKLDWLYNWIQALAIFVKNLQRVYNNKKVGQNISIGRDINPE